MNPIVRMEKFAAGGKCLGFLAGKTVFVENTLPDELIELKDIKHKKDYVTAQINSILEPSPKRITPQCPLYSICGGCNFQHTALENQVKLKSDLLKSSILRTKILTQEEFDSVFCAYSSTPFEYRNRMRFHLMFPGGIPSFEKRNSNALVPFEDCLCAVKPIREELKHNILQERIKKSITQLKNGKYKEEELHLFSLEKEFLSSKDLKKDTFITLETETDKIVNVQLFSDKMISFDVRGFFQSNLKALKNLITSLLPKFLETSSTTRALDMYSGSGTFSVFLQDYFSHIVLMEHNEKSLLQAKCNVDNSKASFVCTSDDSWEACPEAKLTYDLIIADPPRQGLSAKARAWLKTAKCNKFIYVSCNPVTFVRDAKDLVLNGFSMQKLELHDFYPQTSHAETLAVFLRK